MPLHRFPWGQPNLGLAAFLVIVSGCFQPAMGAGGAAGVDPAVAAAVRYETGGSREALAAIERRVRESEAGSPERRRLEESLAAALGGEVSAEARQFLCRQLWLIGTEASLPALERLLGTEAGVENACFALASHPSPAAGETLRRALLDAPPAAQVSIIQLLGDRRDAQAVAALESRLGSSVSSDVQRAIFAALGRIGTPEAARVLASTPLATAPDRAWAKLAWIECAQRLIQTGQDPIARQLLEPIFRPSNSPRFRAAAFLGLIRIDPDPLRFAIETIREPEPLLRATAIAQLASLNDPETTARGSAELARLDPEPQALLIDALAQRKDRALVPALMPLAQSPHPAVARAAIGALGRLGDAAAVPALLGAIEQAGSPAEAAAALSALRALSGEDVNGVLARSLARLPESCQAGVIDVLADRGATNAVPTLRKLAVSGASRTSAAAFRALGRLAGPGQLEALVQLLAQLPENADTSEAEAALVQVARKQPDARRRVAPLLAAYPAAARPAARAALVRALGQLGGVRALGVAIAACHDGDPAVRDAALRATADWPEADALAPVLSMLRQADQPAQHMLLLRGYLRLLALPGQRPAAETVRAYRAALDLARRDEEKKLVLSGLADAAQPATLSLVAPLLDQPNVQAEAIVAALKIAQARPVADPATARAVLEKIRSISRDEPARKQAGQLLEALPR
ncbi:MAG: HEAT repeat domain-containing protein [Verrucomicrobia bacterium]|nr:HEAT repeat domain-containing protein [Verrucomicrobiota bacterium]